MDDPTRTSTILARTQWPSGHITDLATALFVQGFAVGFHVLPAAVDIPVVACTLRDLRPGSDAPRVAIGSAARLDPEAALGAALLEAAQIRATWIAGSRDDLKDPVRADAASAPGAALPLPPRITTSARLTCPKIAGDALDWLVSALAAAGHSRVAAVRLDSPSLGVPVEKLFVPGLLPMRLA
jgi:ribosomal protein S12 methylthiotransferase accessory factor